jgi:hypothetical protein
MILDETVKLVTETVNHPRMKNPNILHEFNISEYDVRRVLNALLFIREVMVEE